MKHAKPTPPHTKARVAVVAALGAGAAVIVPVASAHAATTPQWDAVTIPEASGRWYIDHSSDGLSVGGLQFINSSWQTSLAYLRSHGYDVSAFPQYLYQGMPNVPSKAQQILAAEALLHIQGVYAWANGNATHDGPMVSMFDGGAVPSAVAGLLPHHQAAPGRTYTVRAGDTLWDIAAAHKGSGTNWHSIYDKNRAAIGPNPGLIRPGQILTL